MMSGCHGVMMSGCHGVMMSGCHGVMMSGFHGVMMEIEGRRGSTALPEGGVKPEVLNLAEEGEEGVHLVPGGLWRDVGDLDDLGGPHLHGRRHRAGHTEGHGEAWQR